MNGHAMLTRMTQNSDLDPIEPSRKGVDTCDLFSILWRYGKKIQCWGTIHQYRLTELSLEPDHFSSHHPPTVKLPPYHHVLVVSNMAICHRYRCIAFHLSFRLFRACTRSPGSLKHNTVSSTTIGVYIPDVTSYCVTLGV